MKKIKIPTIVALIILLFGILGGVILIRQGPRWFTRASPEITPKQVKITNIADKSFSVSWITDGQTSGFVKYGTENDLTMTAGDDRDQLSGKTNNFATHHITLNNLNPSTKYYFRIGSGGNLFDNNGQLYQVTTAPTLQTTAPANDVAYGVIIDKNGSPVKGAIVYLSLANTVVLSTITKSSGNWVIPLNLARSSDLSDYIIYDRQASIEEIFVQAGYLGTATAVTVTKYDSPVSTISLGQNFDFRAGQAQPEITPTISPIVTPPTTTTSSESKFNVENITVPPTTIKLTILNPDEGEAISTQKPEILGTAPPAKKINITIQSAATLSGTTTVDNQGNWQWTPPSNLEPGTHTITASFTENGQQQKISRSFVVLAAAGGELPAIVSTPSATIAPTPTPTPISRVSMPSTAGGVPRSGDLTPTFFVSILGLVLIFLGLVFSILLRKQII